MTYKFNQFNVSISNPTWEIQSVTDHYNSTCTVGIVLTTESAEFGVSLEGFTYQNDTWTTEDINAFVKTKLKEYEI
jgi:hypothetical protein